MTFRLFIILAICQLARAATNDCIDVSLSEVQSKVDSAAGGDLIRVPAGSATWSGPLVLPLGKDIRIQAAGISNTIITTSGAFLQMNSGSKISGFQVNVPSSANVAVQIGSPQSSRFRIHDCKISRTGTGSNKPLMYPRGSSSNGDPYGLIDNCDFYNIRFDLQNATLFNFASWAQPLGLGTDQAIYVEDCTFTQDVFGNCFDSNYGTRYVVRYCHFYGCYLEAHGMQSNGNRGTRSWEIYGNVFDSNGRTDIYWPILLRGGTGLCYDNQWIGTWQLGANAAIDVRRAVEGLCMGQDWLRDGNTAIHSGTHTGANGATVLTDSQANFGNLLTARTMPKTNYPAAFWIKNLTSGASGLITANTPITVTASLSGGSRQTWNTSDQYAIAGGYWPRDGIGRSTDEYLSSTNNWAPQASEPAYFDNNTMNGNLMGVSVKNGCGYWCQAGRDYIVNAGLKPGYTPLEYPHPLRQASWSPTNNPVIPRSPKALSVRIRR